MAYTNLETLANRLNFNPMGAHNDGLNIAAAVDLTASRPAGAAKIQMQAHTQNVRYTLDGTTPTATKGFQMKAGDPPIILGIGHKTVLTVIEEAATADFQYQWGE